MLAAEKSHGHVASYIITKYPNELFVQNFWGKNVFLICCEYGIFGIAQWILEHVKGICIYILYSILHNSHLIVTFKF